MAFFSPRPSVRRLVLPGLVLLAAPLACSGGSSETDSASGGVGADASVGGTGVGGTSTGGTSSEGMTSGGTSSGATGSAVGGEAGQLQTAATVTWYEHIAPLMASHCVGCHQAGGIAPFALDSYEAAATSAPAMEEEIQNGTMPPWGAQATDECAPIGTYKNDIRLSDDDKALFSRWVAEGRAEGDPKAAAPLPPVVDLDLKDADRSLTIPSSVSVDGASDKFVCFTLDPEITEPAWLTGSQIQAGNSKVVHHSLVYLDRSGAGAALADKNGQYPCFGGPGIASPRLLAVWAPGAVPAALPENMGTPLQPGDKLVMQVHYHPTGKGAEVDDATRVDLKWTTTEPDYVGGIFLIGNFDQVDAPLAGGKGFGLVTGPDFVIPAGEKDHQEVLRFLLDDGGDPLARLLPVALWTVGTHMHYVGRDMKITATRPNGDEQCLVQTPEWDFDWQRGYAFDGPIDQLPKVYAGDTLTMRCTYDNSLDNPFVAEALASQGLTEPQDVSLGEETLDEMCVGVFGFAVPKKYKDGLGL